MTEATKYRKKPVEIEAMQMAVDTRPRYAVDGDNEEFHRLGSEMSIHNRNVAVWMAENGYEAARDGEDIEDWDESETITVDGVLRGLPEFGVNFITILTLEGEMNASPGDYIIRGVQGEFYPCKPDIFEQTYEAVEAPPLSAHEQTEVDRFGIHAEHIHLASIIHEHFNACRGRGGVSPSKLADVILGAGYQRAGA